jgi:hypothetical protein
MARVKYTGALACAILALASLSASVDNERGQEKPALAGVWTKTGGEVKIEFGDEDVMKIFPHGNNEIVIVVCSYTVAKDALVKAKITALQGKESAKAKESLAIGLQFSFKWRVKGGTATLDDVNGDNLPPAVKAHLEGKYDQKK